jgi:hypothetical protein
MSSADRATGTRDSFNLTVLQPASSETRLKDARKLARKTMAIPPQAPIRQGPSISRKLAPHKINLHRNQE